MITRRGQYYSFSVRPGQTVIEVFQTKYNHDRVLGVVLLPNRNIYGDTIYLEINREIVLPYGFNAGLISFQQFLNTKISDNTYEFNEVARGSTVKVIYTNNNAGEVNIDMLLYTSIGDTEPITHKRKLQIVKIDKNYQFGYMQVKTDFYYDKLVGVFVDYYGVKERLSDWDDSHEYKDVVKRFYNNYMDFCNKASQMQFKNELQDEFEECISALNTIHSVNTNPDDKEIFVHELMNLFMLKVHEFYNPIFNIVEPPSIEAQAFNRLSDLLFIRYIYDDTHIPIGDDNNLLNFGLTVDEQMVYPDDMPLAYLMPRLRKSFKQVMCACNKQVKESLVQINTQAKDFNIYLMYDVSSN
jgi:hypothetical protein